MKKTGVLNKHISEVIASMGHTDLLTICDAGFPIPSSVRRIDIAVKPGLPGFLNTLEAVYFDLEVEQIILAEEIKEINPIIHQEIMKLFDGVEVLYLSHKELKALSNSSRAIIRTGECSPYANIILKSGVNF